MVLAAGAGAVGYVTNREPLADEAVAATAETSATAIPLTSKGDEQPTPWESGDLVFSAGKRATVIGNRSERKYFGQVLAGRSDMWMSEGIAEYIGWYPKSATSSWRRSSVRAVLHGSKRPKSIAARALADDAGPDASDAFYGMGHFAADCMARKYGQGALFDFVRLYLRENRDLDPASRQAFGQSFATIDKACMAWIRDKA